MGWFVVSYLFMLCIYVYAGGFAWSSAITCVICFEFINDYRCALTYFLRVVFNVVG